MSRDPATLLDILKAARLALQFVVDLDRAAFEVDAKTQAAVLHQLMIVGEAVKRLSPKFREQHKQVPWKRVAGMRDTLIHEYDDVDLSQVWQTLQADLPLFIDLLEPLVPQKQEDAK